MLTIEDLVANGTVGENGADVLRDIGAGVQSFLVYSLPRNAGKSTTAEAILAAAPADTARYDFLGTEAELVDLMARPATGYLSVAEMGHRGRPGYLAGEEIGRAFTLVEHGYALATSLHADTVEQVFDVLAQNDVATASVLGVRYLVKVQPLGDPSDPETRRVIQHIHETTGTDDAGHPTTRRLYETGRRR